MTNPVKHMYLYPPGGNAANVLIQDADGDRTPPNLYRIAATDNAAGIVATQQYELTISKMAANNPGTTVTCQSVAPPYHVFI